VDYSLQDVTIGKLGGSRLLDGNNAARGLLQSGTCLFQLADCNSLQAAIHNLKAETNRALTHEYIDSSHRVQPSKS
jgi:hypothetical protein